MYTCSVSAEIVRWGEGGKCDKLMATVLLERLVGNGYLGHFSILCMKWLTIRFSHRGWPVSISVVYDLNDCENLDYCLCEHG